MHASVIGVLVTVLMASGAIQPATPAGQPATGRGAQLAGRGAANPVPTEIPLWENGAPGAMGEADVDKPTLTIYRAARGASGTGVVVAPGGGYGALAMDHEGRQVPRTSTRWGFRRSC